MSEGKAVRIPLLNPNEPEALIAGLHVKEGDEVKAGDLLCLLETTKSTSELSAEVAGYVVGLAYREGETARAGEILCYLAPSTDWNPPEPSPVKTADQATDLPTGLRITEPALKLAREGNLTLANLPTGPLVTASLVRSLLSTEEQAALIPPDGPFDPTAVVVYGGGGHGKSCIDLIRAVGSYRVVGIIDDGISKGNVVMGVPVLGGSEELTNLGAQGMRLAVNAVGGIGDIGSRIEVFHKLAEAGFACPSAAHPRAVIEASATLSAGTQVFPQAYVGSEVHMGFGAIVNTSAIVSHDCVLGDYVNISPGAILAGGVQVGQSALIGMGVTLNLNVRVGARARIGNGATVKADVPDGGIVPAGTIWPRPK